MAFKKLRQYVPIQDDKPIRLTKMGNVVEILSVGVEPRNLFDWVKLDKEQYLNVKTGEIIQCKHSENRGQNITGIKKTFKAMRGLINNNFLGEGNELHVTLTYAENMQDLKKLYMDFQIFIKALRRKYKGMDYICVVEPQARGAWHCHVLLKFREHENVFVDNNSVIWPMWKHGHTKTKGLKGVDNVGAYLTAYLTDVVLDDDGAYELGSAQIYNQRAWITVEDEYGNEKQVKAYETVDLKVVEKLVEENGQKVKKQFVKGARLHLYPPGMNIYRCSRGIKKPVTEKMEYGEAKKIVGSRPADYSRTTQITRYEKPVNSYTYEYYNNKRGKSQIRGKGK